MAALFDRFKRLLQPEQIPVDKKVLTQEIGGPDTSGVRQPVGGYPADGLTPTRLATILKAADQGNPLEYFELAEQAEERDTHYLAVLGKRKRQVSKIPLRVEAASDAPEHVKQAEYVTDWLKRDTLKAELRNILDAVGKGISFTEIIWDNSEGQWWPQRLEWADPRFFTFAQQDLKTPLLRTRDGDVLLPPAKFITAHIQAKSGLPIRSGIARTALWGWMFKMFTSKDWAVFLQTYGQPIRLGRYPSGATDEDKSKLLRAVTNIAGDCAAIVPQGMDIEFVEAKTQSQSAEHFERRANWLDQQISKLVLGQTATTDAIAGGHAVGKEHREVEEDLADSDACDVEGVLNGQLMRPWIDLEFGRQKQYPRFVMEEPDETDIPVFVKAATDLSAAGLPVSKKQLYDKTGLVPPESDDDTLMAVPSPQPGVGETKGKVPLPSPRALPKKPQLMAAEAVQSEADIADALTESSMDDWEEFVSPIVAQIREKLKGTTTMTELAQKFAELAGEIDTSSLEAILRDAQVTAHIAGLVGVPRKG